MTGYWELFYVFFKIGLFTFGGGYAMIPLIIDEVTSRGWVSEATLLDFVGVSEVTPGPFAVNTATFIGLVQRSFPGAVVATFGVTLPSFIVILIIARIFDAFRANRHIAAALRGFRACAVGLICFAAYRLISAGIVLESGIDYRAAIILAISFVLIRVFKKAHPVVFMGGAAVVGMLIFGPVGLFP